MTTKARKPPSAALPAALRALADPTRLRILLRLEGKRRTVGEIGEFFALSQPTISRHLQTLSAAGLVERKREAQKVYYETHALNVGAVCISLADAFPSCAVAVRHRSPRARLRSPRKPTGRKSRVRMSVKKRPKA